ncbi:MAG: DUF7313 family protein [Haloferacaceae archaeon]
MQPLQFAIPIEGLEAVAGVLPHIILVFVLVTMATRLLAHRRHEAAIADGAESLSRFYPHWILMGVLTLVSFAYLIVRPHAGIILSMFVLSTFVSDFFEFEARNVEARNGMELERPKAALTSTAFLLLYAAYQSLFFLVAPFWGAIV